VLQEVQSVGLSKHTLYAWKRKFGAGGPAALVDGPRGGPAGSRLPKATRRALLRLQEANPDGGGEPIAALLLRGPALPASPQAIARVLPEAGYDLEESPTRPHTGGPTSRTGCRRRLSTGAGKKSCRPRWTNGTRIRLSSYGAFSDDWIA
jgi:hypothetical protein